MLVIALLLVVLLVALLLMVLGSGLDCFTSKPASSSCGLSWVWEKSRPGLTVSILGLRVTGLTIWTSTISTSQEVWLWLWLWLTNGGTGELSLSALMTASLELTSLLGFCTGQDFFLIDLYLVKTGFLSSSDTRSAELLYFWDSCNKDDDDDHELCCSKECSLSIISMISAGNLNNSHFNFRPDIGIRELNSARLCKWMQKP